MRRSVAVFAVFALLLLVLRPACDLLALDLPGAQSASTMLAHSDTGPAGLSQGGAHWSSLATVVKAPQELFVAPAFIVALLSLGALAFFARSAAPNTAPLPARSYYARSARIQR